MILDKMLFCGLLMAAMSVGAADALRNPALNPVKIAPSPVHEPLLLATGGKAHAVVIIPALPPTGDTPAQVAARKSYAINRKAALELIEAVHRVTGVELPLLHATDTLPPDKKRILIGESALTEAEGMDASVLPLEGFRVKTFADGVAIVGRMPDERENYRFGGGLYALPDSAALGVRFGVYDVLERFLGMRYFHPGEGGMVVPRRGDWTMPPCDYSDAPVYAKRTGAHWAFWNTTDAINDHTGRLNFSPYYRAGDSSYLEFGIHSPINFGIHGKTAPECMELYRDGSRSQDFPCYGNPKTAQLMFEDLIRFYSGEDTAPFRSPRSGRLWSQPTESRIVVSPPDKPVACCCPDCARLWQASAGAKGSASRLMAAFVNDLAGRIAAKWPDKRVIYYPYMNYLSCPDDLRLQSNVVPFLCLTYGTGNRKEPYVNAYDCDLITRWSKAAGGRRVLLYEYLCWPAESTSLPFLYPHLLKKFYQENRNRIIGVFIDGHPSQGGRRVPADTTPGGEWAYSHFNTYCWYRLLWNPDFDVDAALADYCESMYGSAAPEMKAIFSLLADRWENTRWSEKVFGQNVKSSLIHRETMPLEICSRLAGLLARAEARGADQPLTAKRLALVAVPIRRFLSESERFHSGINPVLAAQKIGADPLIDGKPDGLFNGQEKYHLVPAYEIPAANYTSPTMFRVVWTAEGISFGILNYEAFKPVTRYGNDDIRLATDDSIELFIQKAGEPYCHLIVNRSGARLMERGSDGSFRYPGVKVAAFPVVSGSNHHWFCEIFIPFKALNVTPVPNLEFEFNLIRNRVFENDNHVLKRYYRWNTRFRPAHNDPEAFGTLKLVE